MKITNETARRKIEEIKDGMIFSVTFIKRSTGEIRSMRCRKGVHSQGNTPSYVAAQHNLITVYDMAIGDFRCINLETIINLVANKKRYTVNDFSVRDWIFTWINRGTKMERTIRGRTEGEAKITFKREMSFARIPSGLTIEDTI